MWHYMGVSVIGKIEALKICAKSDLESIKNDLGKCYVEAPPFFSKLYS